MEREDLFEFARRDRAAVAELRATHWAEVRRAGGVAALLAIGDALRLEVQTRRPVWPDAAERRADHDVHARVSQALRRVRIAPGR